MGAWSVAGFAAAWSTEMHTGDHTTRLKALAICTLCAVLASSTAFAADRPDLTGVWGNYRPPGQDGPGPLGAPVPAEPLPLRPDARARIDDYRALVSPLGDTPGGFCVGTGMPGAMLSTVGYPMEIVQHEDVILVIYELHTEIRHVYLTLRVPDEDLLPDRNGYSVGRWEGDTLVVETTHLTESVEQTRYPHSSQATIVERYRLIEEEGNTVLTVGMTLTDPAWYTEPVMAERRWSLMPDGRLLSYECDEDRWLDHLDRLRGEQARSWTARTPDGQPDLQGTWVNFDSTPFEAPAEQTGTPGPGGGAGVNPAPEFAVHDSPMPEARRSMVIDPPDGRVPVMAWAERQRDRDLELLPDAPEHETPWVRCITRGFPAGMFQAGYNNAHRIIQIPGHVVIASEMIHETRIIPTDGRPRPGEGIRHWNGESRGRWEGDTLIVETTNFNDKGDIATSGSQGRIRGIPQTPAMRVVERFRRVDADTIEYEVTIVDPTVYTAPWTVAMPFTRDDEYRFLPYECHEGNLSLPNALSFGRVRDAEAAREE
jgi:hypothetical protein